MKSWSSSEVAAVWKLSAEARNQILKSATERMLAEAQLVAGARVLDLGTGTGDTALAAAERVGPTGAVVAIDSSPNMVGVAIEAVKTAGATNVVVRVMDAASLDFEADTFDAVIARQVLMFVDLAVTFAQVHRVLRPGGRLSCLVWGPAADNPFHGSVLEAARTNGGWGAHTPHVVRAFSIGDPEVYRSALDRAGFVNVSATTVRSERRFASAAEALEAVRESPLISEPLGNAAAWADLERRFRGFERDGGCAFPVSCLVIAAEK